MSSAFATSIPPRKSLREVARIGAHLVKEDAEYLASLRRIANPPPYLLYMVTRRLQRSVSRSSGREPRATLARRMAQRLGLEPAAKDFAVVSELARGIEARRIGARSRGGTTIAIMGCGIDVICPAEHRKLAAELVEKGGALPVSCRLARSGSPKTSPRAIGSCRASAAVS